MRIIRFSIFLLFFLVSTNTFAQDSQQIPLPQGAI